MVGRRPHEDQRTFEMKASWTGRHQDAVIIGTHKRADETWYDVMEFGRFSDTVFHVPPQNMHGVTAVGTGGRLKFSRPKGWMFYDRRLVYNDPSMSLDIPGSDVKERIARAQKTLQK